MCVSGGNLRLRGPHVRGWMAIVSFWVVHLVFLILLGGAAFPFDGAFCTAPCGAVKAQNKKSNIDLHLHIHMLKKLN